MDGLQALAAIRDKARFKQPGAHGYVAKPIAIDQLKVELEQVVSL